ncbi:MAG: polysaccharide deacetylase family protein, partial [Steroidobacter sp.]
LLPSGLQLVNLCRADKLLLSGGAALLGSAAVFGATPLSVGVPLGALALAIADGVFRPSSSTLYPTISRGPRDQPRIALTFDDGPHAETTPRVLDALAAAGARATFFVIGRNLERNAQIAERTVAEGHELGNHSWTHSYFQNFYSAARHTQDIARNTRLIREMTGAEAEPLYRPPVGLKSPPLARAAHSQHLRIIAWSLHTRDTISRDANALAARVLARIQPGDIVLMHDGHDREGARRVIAAQALPHILRGLNERRLECVTVSELLTART